MVAVIAFSAIGVYKLITQNQRENQQEELTVVSGEENQQEQEEGSQEETNIGSNYNWEISPSEVAAKVIPSVVCIQNYQQSAMQQYPFAQTLSLEEKLSLAAEGSGIIYTEDGYIITNAHVVEGASLIKVVLDNKDVYEAKLVGIDEDTDLALIKIEANGLTAIEIGDDDKLAVGDFVKYN